MIFKQETIQSWFSGVGSSINSEVIQPFQNAEQVIWKYNRAIQHNSLTQQGWERLLAQSDDSLRAYLTSIKGTTATMSGYNVSLVGATVKTVALKVATIALNSAITWGASLIISGVVSAISEWIHKTENMISASEDAIEKIKSINDELKNNQKTISDTAKRYAELAQGVNQLTGENISLSNEDYEEFLTLSNQLAEMFPTLTRNYNDNGDAIVQLSGNVDTIVGSLQNLIEAQRDLANRQIVDELPTVFKGIAAKSNQYEQQLSDLESRRDALVKSLGDVQSEEFSSNFMDGFSNKWIEISGDNLEVISQMRDDYMKILKEANIDFEELTPTYEMKDGIEVPVGFTIKINSSDEDVNKAKSTIDGKIQELASQYETDINKLNEEINTTNEKNKTNWNSLSSSIFAWLSTDDSFKVMDDTMQATVQNIVNSLDWESLNFSSWEDAKQYIQENILSLFNTPEGKETLEDIEVMFGIQTQFNNGNISVEQYQQKLQDFLNSIENLPPETKKSILLLFGIQTNDDGTTTSDVDTMVENVKKKLKGTEFDDKVGELSLGDLKIAANLEVDDDTIQSWDDLIDRIEKAKSETFNNETDIQYTISSSISQIATQLEPQFAKLGEAYKSIFTDDEFTLDDVDNSMLEGLRKSFAEIEEEVGVTFDATKLNSFFDALTNGNSSAEQVQQAFNDLATSYFYSTDTLAQLNEETADSIVKQLEELGVVNAKEIVYDTLNAKTEALALQEQFLAQTGIELANASNDKVIGFLNQAGASETARTYLFQLITAEQVFSNQDLNTSDKITKLKELANAYGQTAIAARISYLEKAKEYGHVPIDYDKELASLQDDINNAVNNVKIDFKGVEKDTDTSSSSSSEKDTWLEEYKKKLAMLEDQLAQELINEKEFYEQSEALLNQYLKDTPYHIEKYAEEISDAEKKLHDDWNSAFDFEKGNLENKLSDKLITDIEYYKELSKLNNEYYRPTGILNNGKAISDEQIASVKEYTDVLEKLKDSTNINAEPEFATAFEKISKVAKESGISVENLIETYNKVLDGDDRYGKFTKEFESNNRDIRDSLRNLYQDLFNELDDSVNKLQDAFKTIGDAIKEYSESQTLSINTVQELLSLNPLYLSMLMDENGQLQLNEETYQKLSKAKLEQIVNDMGLSVAEQILAIETHEQAVAALEAGNANMYLAETERLAADVAVDNALKQAYSRSIAQNDSSIYDAAKMLSQSYENAKKLMPMVSFDTQSLRGENADKENTESEYEKEFDLLNRLLERLNKTTEKITKTIDKYINYVKKNNAINRAVKSIDTEITQNSNAYDFYMKKAKEVGLNSSIINKIQNGEISIETITDEELGDKIDQYIEWYDKAQDVKDTIDDLFDKQRDLIRQKLDNVLDYYSDMDSYLSSITSKVESLISLNDQMGKRSSLTELVEQFASLNNQIESVTASDETIKQQIGFETDDSTKISDDIKSEIEEVQKGLENSAIYQNIINNIKNTNDKIIELDAIGYDNLTKKQKKTYDKLVSTLEDYYAQKESLDKGATSSNIAEYNKIYLAWKKLQDKLDLGKNLSTSEWKKYNTYTGQLENWVNEKATKYEELNNKLQDALNPSDKTSAITKEYEESSKQMYDSYQNQIDTINDEIKNTQNYKNLIANIQKLEQKKNTKGLSKSDENKLKKYKAELEALEKGGNAANVSNYMKTWESWYKLQQKLDNGKKLSASEATKYDEYKAKLEAWNNEKQTQINDLLSLMEDDLEQLNKTYTENLSDAELKIDEYYGKLYSLAKEIAEYNIDSLEQQLSVIQSMVSYYKNLAGLYETFSGDKLSRLLIDLDEDAALSKLEIYQKQLVSLNEQYDITKSKLKEYQQLLDALDANDFESSMALFDSVLNDSSVSQATKDNLQQVIDLLNERAVNADNWGEYADQWENEWQQALSETKQSLIDVVGSIQEVNDAIRETSLEPLADAITQLGYLKDTLSSITSLINDDWIFDDKGNLTEYGNAKVSLLVEQMQNARNEAGKYAEQMNKIMSMRDTYSSDTAYQTALQETKQNYLNSLNDLKGFEDSIVSIMTQSNEAITESLKDVISARIDALKAQKDLYEYNKSITNSQKEVDNIKAQIDALENLSDATDAATKAKLAQLKADLEEKETALQETKDDHTYNLQIDALEEFMNTLDETMSNATDAVNKSFETYKEAIDSALKVYEENKDYLGEWSNTIMKNVLGFTNGNVNTIDLDISQSGSGDSGSIIPSIKIENGETVSTVEAQSETLHEDLVDIRTAIEQGIIVKVESPLATMNPEMMNFMANYVPPMANIVNTILPQIAEKQNTQTVVNMHYDNLLNVEGNVDKDFAKVLPEHLEEAYRYTTKKLYKELNILK